MARKPDRFQFATREVQAHERQRIQQWIAEGKTEQALDMAKEIHRRLRNEESETLLFRAYDARFQWHLGRNTTDGAKALLEHVSKTYPHAADLLSKWNAALALRQGDADSLLAALSDPSATPELQARAADWIRGSVTDLRGIAESSKLAPDHPMRVAAAALFRAFAAVTSGPVADSDLALHEVSRQSPLAPWKMLVRAIAAFYRKDDALCERYLSAVDPDSAPARLAPALRALMRGEMPANRAAKALVHETSGSFETLRHALTVLDRHLEGGKHPLILQGIRDAVTACQEADPSLLERLRQHISIRCVPLKLNPDRVAEAMKGWSLKNAHFWRLLARATEEQKGGPIVFPIVCSYWEEFRKHAIHEGWFRESGPEPAALYLHMDDLWHKISPDSVDRARQDFIAHFPGNRTYYDGQPPEIRALMPSGKPDLYYLHPYQLLQRACAADPCSENFRRWLRSADGSPHLADRIAEQWTHALPRDIPPLIFLMESAEKRNALQKAFKYMERAEQIDGVNSEVRRARLRLLVSMTVRHLKEEKQRLAERDLSLLEELPQAQQGDRPAFIAALRWVANAGAPPPALTPNPDPLVVMTKTLGNVTAAMTLVGAVIERCGMGTLKPTNEPKEMALAASLGRACALGDDMATPVTIADLLLDRIEKEIGDAQFRARATELLALGEAAIRQNRLKLGYLAASAGLAQGTESQARFLYLRARALPEWEDERRSGCLEAASELARRQRDSDLLNRIGEFRDHQLSWLDIDEDRRTAAISTEQIAAVVERETKERDYPKSTRASQYLDGSCNCPECRARRSGMPSLPPELEEMVEALGPEAVAQALAEIIGLGGPGGGRRKRRRKPLSDDDLPF